MQKKDPDKKWWHIDGMSDKQMHAVTGACIFLAVDFVLPAIFAYLIVLLFGFAKEIYDTSEGGRFDWMDVVATIVGALIIHPIICYL